MSVVTDTTDHENGIGVVVLGWQTIRAWIPAYAGMTAGVVGRLFSEEWEVWLDTAGFHHRPCVLSVLGGESSHGPLLLVMVEYRHRGNG